MARGRPLQRRDARTLARLDVNSGPRRGCLYAARARRRNEAGARAQGSVLWTSRRDPGGPIWLYLGCLQCEGGNVSRGDAPADEEPDSRARRWEGFGERQGGGSCSSRLPHGDAVLVAADGPALIDFVKQAFGAEEIMRADTPMGGVHGEVRIGDSMMMVGGGVPGKNFPGQLKQNALHVYVKDVDAATEKAVSAGATLIDEPRDQ